LQFLSRRRPNAGTSSAATPHYTGDVITKRSLPPAITFALADFSHFLGLHDFSESTRIADGVVFLSVRVQPRASRSSIGGAREGALVVRLTAPPVDGAANAALLRLLGQAFAVAPSSVRILGGATARTKRVSIAGIDLATARERLRRLEGGAARPRAKA